MLYLLILVDFIFKDFFFTLLSNEKLCSQVIERRIFGDMLK